MSPTALPRVSMRKCKVGMRESVSCFMSSWCRNGKRLLSNDKTPASNVSGRTERKTAQCRMSPVVSTRVMLTNAPLGKVNSVSINSPSFCWSKAFNWLTRLEGTGLRITNENATNVRNTNTYEVHIAIEVTSNIRISYFRISFRNS